MKEGNNNISAYWVLLFANYRYLGEHALESSSAYGRGLELGGRRGLHLGVVRRSPTHCVIGIFCHIGGCGLQIGGRREVGLGGSGTR